MKILGQDDYLTMRAEARVLEADSFGDKVLLLADGTMLKFFRRKRWLSSAAWYPYAQRFADNAASLRQRDIRVPEVIDVFRIPSIKRDAVHYHPLVGSTLRELRRQALEPAVEQQLKEGFTRFLVGLHERGVYFRSLHLGNVVYTPDRQFGLIDIADVRISDGPLRKYQRARNLRRLQAMPEESEWVDFHRVVNGHQASSSGGFSV